MYPYALQGDNLSIVINFKTHILSRGSHPNFDRVLQAIRDEQWDTIPDLVDIASNVARYAAQVGQVEVRNGSVYYDGVPMANVVVDRIFKMIEEGFSPKPLMAFLDNLKRNPSRQAVQELYLFLETGMMPLTEDGCFLAFKKVRDNYFDVHSNTVSHKPTDLMSEDERFEYTLGYLGGVDNNVLTRIINDQTVVSMPRNEVDDVRDRTCSSGLHFCSLAYLPNFGSSGDDRVLIVKVNPADVVSIPSDYNNTKGRTCRYTVVAEHDAKDSVEEAFSTSVDTRYATSVTPETLRERQNAVPRAVREDEDYFGNPTGRYRFVDDGTYASREAHRDYQDYLYRSQD